MSDSSRAWSWRHAILKSDLPPTTRHVLLTLSCFMNDVGGGCYPTQEDLAKASGLTDRAVRKHLELAESAGWLKRNEHGFRGQRWRNTEYWALWPDLLDVEEGAERGSSPSAQRSGTTFRKVRNDVPTTTPDNSNTPKPPEGAKGGPALDVVPGRSVHAEREEALYLECCAVKNRKASLTDQTGGWFFEQAVIDEAKARLARRML